MEVYSKENLEDYLRVKKRFLKNLENFWSENHFYLFLLAIAAIVDAASTIYFMHIVGPEKEIHPIIRELSFQIGPLFGPILGKILQVSVGMVAVIYLRKYASHILVICAIMYSWAATANFIAFM